MIVPFVLNPTLARFSILERGAIARQNNKGEKESPWKIPLLILHSSNSIGLFSFGRVNRSFHVFIVVFTKLHMTGSNLYMVSTFSIHLCGTLSYAFL